MDLDEWLLSVRRGERARKFSELLATATPLDRAEQWKRTQREKTEKPTTATPETEAASDLHEEERSGDSTSIPSATGAAIEEAAAKTRTSASEVAAKREGDGDQAAREDGPEERRDEQRPEGDANAGAEVRTKPTAARKLRDEVYRKVLEECPPLDVHVRALAGWGVVARAVAVGRLGSLDATRARNVAARLSARYGNKRLLSVPGFEAGQAGRVHLSLPGQREYVLLPCSDAHGLVAALEAIPYDPEKGELVDPDRTITLSGAGAHLYVFAHHDPDEIEGFCEGPLGAILAAQQDVVLGAVGHFRRYTADAGSARNKEQVGAVLPELEGVDFEGREISYAPEVGPGERNARAREATNAVDFLVDRQNGKHKLVDPRILVGGAAGEGENAAREIGGSPDPGDSANGTDAGEDARMDPNAPTSLASCLLAVPEEERQERLKEMFPASPRREEPDDRGAPDEDRSREQAGGNEQDKQPDGSGEASSPALPSRLTLSLMALAGMVAAVVAYILIGRLKSFSEYVGVGFGGQPFMGGGIVGALRRLSLGAPFDILYAHQLSFSALVGLLGLSAALCWWYTRRRSSELSEELQRFATGPWSAHRPGEVTDGRAATSRGAGTLREVCWGVVGTLGAYAVIRLALALVEKGYAAAASLGLVSDSYQAVFEGASQIALLGALLVCGYILLRRIGRRSQTTKVIKGRV